jgi:hypothetical protein
VHLSLGEPQHHDPHVVSLRFAAATLSRDTLRSGLFTVGRAVANKKPTRTSTAPIQMVITATRAMRTYREREILARRTRPRRPPSQKSLARLLALRTTGIGTSMFVGASTASLTHVRPCLCCRISRTSAQDRSPSGGRSGKNRSPRRELGPRRGTSISRRRCVVNSWSIILPHFFSLR